MIPFIEENLKLKISRLLTELTDEASGKQKITIYDIDVLLEHIAQKYTNAIGVMANEAKNELSIAYFGSLVIALTALKVADTQNPRPIDAKWLFPEKSVDPNLVLEGLLVNIANQCLSTINLATSGFAWSARIILRSTLELTWLTLVLVNQREKMLRYCEGVEDEKERDLFHKYFSGGKLMKELSKIEESLFFAEDISKLLSNARSETYTLFTKHVHNSFTATILGTRAPSITQPKEFEYALFSVPSTSARGVVSSLNHQVLFYLIALLLPSLKLFHSFDSVKLWDDIATLRDCFVMLYLQQIG